MSKLLPLEGEGWDGVENVVASQIVRLRSSFAGGSPAASHFSCFAKKVTKKGEPAAPLFVWFFCRC
jgi:hypothetical protein